MLAQDDKSGSLAYQVKVRKYRCVVGGVMTPPYRRCVQNYPFFYKKGCVMESVGV